MVQAEEFIRVWQTSKNVKEVAAKTGMTEQGVWSRCTHYRQKGVPLRQHQRRGRAPVNDYKALAKLARELARELVKGGA